jgi:hypothetical protein
MVVLPRTELTEYVAPEVVRTVAQAAIEQIVSQLGVSPDGPPQ